MAVGMKLRSGRVLKAYVPKRRRSSNFKKAVTTIAKKVVSRQAETKNGATQASVAFGTSGFLLNVFQAITQGVQQNNRIGDEVRTLGFRIRARIGQDTNIITGLQDQNAIRMIVAVGKQPLDINAFPDWQAATDPDNMIVLRDKYINFSTTKRMYHINQYIKVDRKILWDNAGVITKNPVYIYLVGNGGTGLLASSGNVFNYNVQRFWKDL